uniref:hypothetical protein n=1 Tax=Roseivirga sp. TaxID=1964215 RepID=UPI004047A9BF
MKRILITFLLAFTIGASAQTGNYIYKTIAMRAAPGHLLELIDLLKSDMSNKEVFTGEAPRLMRHSQGDQWDLLMIVPIGYDLEEYFKKENVSKRAESKTQDQAYGSDYFKHISWQEEGFYFGPAIRLFNNRFNEMSYYHVEMFKALAGKQSELLSQREMENVYLNEIKREPNFIFTKIMGSAVDIFTVGLYRDIKHFAESADIPLEVEDVAAKKAGFESVNTIGSYLRSLLLEHHDTLAGAVRPNR